jgi:Fic family protein
MKEKMKIIDTKLIDEYKLSIIDYPLKEQFEKLQDAKMSTDTFSFHASAASVFSNKIEGEEIDFDSYIKHKTMGTELKSGYTKKIDDLYDAYIFAKQNPLTPQNISKVHAILAQNFVAKQNLGKFRSLNMYITTDDGCIEYAAASPYRVEKEMRRFYHDIALLLSAELSIEEIFYYAAFLHLAFVKIQPWNDGNGKSARLIEKWFLARKLGEKAWFLQSEKMYYLQHQSYYENIRLLGLDYSKLDYSRALPFLLMLPKSMEL